MKRKSDKFWYGLFTLPLVFVFTTVVLIPFIIGIGYSFFSWDGLPLNPKVFVGVDNFIKLFSDTRFLSSAGHTIFFTLLAIIIINVLGLTFALIVTTKLKVRNLARTMLFMPYLIGGLILGYIWKFIFSDAFANIGEQTGLTNFFFNWLLDYDYALVALVVVATWQMAGYIMIIYIAGIQGIPEDVIEAAAVDGAGFFNTLFRIKFPLIMPSFTICLFLTLSNCFKIFDVNLSLTGGGPNNATEMFAMNIYNEIFQLNNYGYGQAKAIIFFIVVASVTLVQVSITKKKEVSM
ncbi:carbohydrate ABC transporter membrane protein 1 (CUT1 family) [Mobilisporobacter senegalensis]|uniref:Carbohydrate ABC transporter membrane protein 1 (CUT1 family) n=1 Tax=Mobilisporobacter senegalensis TaxID=1329262 RepID=A0A3N1Y2N2_9FIRM|nr:sugar ABC transporter permease [Mobilisporobacter senegalensis]ROR31527.1 carbohydrate ABC transporter membrane protein 1 (CUT1 family) [Mobilisporobacter senegalensis]